MESSRESGRFLPLTIVIFVGVLIAFVTLLLLPHSVSANPMVFFKIEIFLTENGLPYDRPTRLTSFCYLPEDLSDVYQSDSISCLRSPCILHVYSIGSACDLRIERVEGEDLVINGYVAGRHISGAVIRRAFWQEFKLTIDIADGTSQLGELESTGGSIITSLTVFGIALAMTLLVEVSVLLIMKPILKLTGVKVSSLIPAGCIASLITLPAVWFIFPRVWSLLPVDSYVYCVVVTEFFVVIIEAGIYTVLLRMSTRHAFWLSLLANALSFLIGVQLL